MSQLYPQTTFNNVSLSAPYRTPMGVISLPNNATLYAQPAVADHFNRQPSSLGSPPLAETSLPPEPSVGIQPLSLFQKLGLMAHPKRTATWLNLLRVGNDPSTLRERLTMMATLHHKLDKAGKVQLENLLKNGILTDTDGDDPHATLYYLYAVATTPRAKGLTCKNTLKEVIATLDNPYRISQQFNRLEPKIAQEMLAAEATAAPIDPRQPRSAENFAALSNSCQASSIMFVMAQTQPKELARMAYGLTSPRLATREKVRLDQLADSPLEAIQRLQESGIPYKITGPSEVTVALKLPTTAYERMVNDAKQPGKRNGVDAALQSAFINLVSRGTYDALSDTSWDSDSALVSIENASTLPEAFKGTLKSIILSGQPMTDVQRQFLMIVRQLPMLSSEDRAMLTEGIFTSANGQNEAQIALARSILQDKGSVDSVEYMACKPNPDVSQNDSRPYLYGYTRSFDKITEDLIKLLSK
jgi:hypothetical protein